MIAAHRSNTPVRGHAHFTHAAAAGFDAIYLRDELTPAIPGRSITLDPAELQTYRPSYRLVAYVLSKQGYTIAPDLPGEDLPETVQALMQEIFNWAGIKPH
jgi:hypothetical protein